MLGVLEVDCGLIRESCFESHGVSWRAHEPEARMPVMIRKKKGKIENCDADIHDRDSGH